jgi:hypothetical protein
MDISNITCRLLEVACEQSQTPSMVISPLFFNYLDETPMDENTHPNYFGICIIWMKICK